MNTRSFLTLTALALATTGLVACNNNDGMDDTAATSATADPTTGAGGNLPDMDPTVDPMNPMDPDAMGTDTAATEAQGEALALVMSVDRHEIDAAEQALDEDLPADVAEYAEMLRTEHTRNLEAGEQLEQDSDIRSVETDRVDAQKEKGEAVLERLDELEGQAYSDAYIDAMVKGHTGALAMIDDQLLPAATDAALRDHLTASREAVAKHLERAEELQGE